MYQLGRINSERDILIIRLAVSTFVALVSSFSTSFFVASLPRCSIRISFAQQLILISGADLLIAFRAFMIVGIVVGEFY